MKIVRNTFLYSLLALFCISCAVRKNLESGVGKAFDALLLPQIGIAQALVESTAEIYLLDSIESEEPIFIRSFMASYIGSLDTFELAVDSIEARFAKDGVLEFRKINVSLDSIIYSEMSITNYGPLRSMEDITRMNIHCEYWPHANFGEMHQQGSCLSASYALIGKGFIREDGFKECTE